MIRTARTTALTAAVLGLAAGLGGCGNPARTTASHPAAASSLATSAPSDPPAPTTAATTVATPSPAGPSPVVYATFSPPPFLKAAAHTTLRPTPVTPPAGPVEFGGPAAARFGAAPVAAAYEVATAFETAGAFDPAVVSQNFPTLAEVDAAVGTYLDAAGQDRLASYVADQDKDGNLSALFSYGDGTLAGYRLDTTTPFADRAVGPPTDAKVYKAPTGDQLYLRFTISGTLRFAKAGKPYTLAEDRDVQVWLAPTPGGGQSGWQVDAWNGQFLDGPFTPAP